jgi:hypothetical protein
MFTQTVTRALSRLGLYQRGSRPASPPACSHAAPEGGFYVKGHETNPLNEVLRCFRLTDSWGFTTSGLSRRCSRWFRKDNSQPVW